MKHLLIAVFLLFATTALATLPASDTFDSGTGNLPTGGDPNWAENTNGTGHFKIDAGNTFATATDNTQDIGIHWTGDTFANAHCSSIVVGVVSTAGAAIGPGYGPAVRMRTLDTQKTYVRIVGDSHGWELLRLTNAVGVSLATNATAFVAGHTVELCVKRVGANDIYTYTDNGVAMSGSPFTDTSPLTAGAPGIAHSSTSTVAAGIASWSARNLPVGGGIGPLILQ